MKFFKLSGCLFLCAPFFLHAQLCTGNLGDPIINITFGDGYTDPLPLSCTSYNYAGGCPEPGEYTINNLLFGCGNNTWFLLAGDHARETPKGNYILVNAGDKPGKVYTTTVTGLCANTTYEFGAWITNVMQHKACDGNAINPDLTMTVTTTAGNILASYKTGEIAETDFKTWNHYGLFFTTPADVGPFVLTISSTNGSGCGNAFALDDITLRACGPSVVATLDGNNISYIDVCAGYENPFILNATYSSGFTDPRVQWQNSFDTGITWKDIPGAITATYAIPRRKEGVVLYRMLIASRVNFNSLQCRISSNVIWTNVHPLPVHDPPTNWIGCLNKDFNFSVPLYPVNYHWVYPNGYETDSAIPTIHNMQYKDSGLYRVVMTAEFGCKTQDSFYLNVYPGTTVSINTNQSICEGNTIKLSATGDGKYQWTPHDGLSNDMIPDPYANPIQSTQYKVTLTNSYGCKDSTFVNIKVYKKLVANAGPDQQIINGDTVILNAAVSGTDVSFYWSPPDFINDVYSLHPSVYPQEDIIYNLHASSAVGCGEADLKVGIKVYKDIFIPNAFTPNGDGKNDKFKVITLNDYKLLRLIIYNRSGQLIFKTNTPGTGWDGTGNNIDQSMGTYVYYLEMQAPNGKTIAKHGTIVLIR